MLTLRKKEFHCAKSAIPINHINNDKTVISEVLYCAKKILSISLATKIINPLHRFMSCSQDWAGIQKFR